MAHKKIFNSTKSFYSEVINFKGKSQPKPIFLTLNYSWCLKSSWMSDLEHKKGNERICKFLFSKKWIIYHCASKLPRTISFLMIPFLFFCSYIYIPSFTHFLWSLVCVNMLLCNIHSYPFFWAYNEAPFCGCKYWLLGMSVCVFVGLHFIPLNLEFLMRKSLCWMLNKV